MDNKITKQRFYNLMSYEWILMIVILLAGIFVFELLYAFFGVEVTTGQNFKYYYDINVDNSLESGLLDVLLLENKTFSDDVLVVQGEVVNEEANILNSRMRVQEGDIIITDVVEEEGKAVRAKSLIDSGAQVPIYDFEKLLLDGREYLTTFLKDEFLSLSYEEKLKLTENKDNLSVDKIDSSFLLRYKKDNRFRTEEQKKEGIESERKRIFKLVDEINDFSHLIEVGDEKGLFFRHTKYSQRRALATDESAKATFDTWIKEEIDNGKGNAIYGLRVENLKGGKHNPSEFFKVSGRADAKDVVILVFDFLSYQRELQFETVCYINSVVRACSDIYEKEIV